MALTQKTSRKKSSESIVQPRKAARKVCRWDRVSRRKSFRTDIYARIAGTRDSGTENRDSNFLSRAGLSEPDNHCCNISQSISIEVARGDFARKTAPIFCAFDKRLPSPPTAAQWPVTERTLR